MKQTSGVIGAIAGSAAAVAFSISAYGGACNINMSANQQVIDGYGMSSAWCGQFSGAKNNALYNTLGFSLLRIRIDPNQYWADETANASAAHSFGVKVLGTPWSPPAYMKDNNNVVHGSLLPSQYGAYATYLNQAANSIGLDYVSIQNEPDWDPDYEGCVWNGTQLQTFCHNNAQVIGRPVVMPEAVNFNDSLSDPTLNDATAASHVTFIAGHFYGGGNSVHQNALNHGKHVWETEHYLTGGQSDFNVCMQLAKEVSDAMNNQFSAYFWWWVNDSQSDGTDLVNNNGSIIKPGYILGQFAKWIRPGSTRVSSDYNPSSGVYVTAYRVNGGTVIVVVNNGSGSANQQFNIQNGNAGSMEGYRTTSSQSMADIGGFTVSGGSFTANLPGNSVTTFVQTGSGGGSRSAFSKIEAESYDSQSGVQTETCSEGGLDVGFIENGDYIEFNNVDFGTGAASFQARVASATSGGSIQVRLDSTTGPLVGTCSVAGTGGWQTWTTDSVSVSGASGTHNLYLVFTGGSGYLFNVNWVQFTSGGGGGLANGTYKLIARHSGKAMDASGAGTANGTQIIQWTYGGGNNQKWTVTSLGGGLYSIIGVQSGKSIDINNWGTSNGTKVQLWDYLGGTNQKFLFTATSGGYYEISPSHATGSCLDVSGVSTADGANVQLWQWLNGQNQQWAPQAP